MILFRGLPAPVWPPLFGQLIHAPRALPPVTRLMEHLEIGDFIAAAPVPRLFVVYGERIRGPREGKSANCAVLSVSREECFDERCAFFGWHLRAPSKACLSSHVCKPRAHRAAGPGTASRTRGGSERNVSHLQTAARLAAIGTTAAVTGTCRPSTTILARRGTGRRSAAAQRRPVRVTFGPSAPSFARCAAFGVGMLRQKDNAHLLPLLLPLPAHPPVPETPCPRWPSAHRLRCRSPVLTGERGWERPPASSGSTARNGPLPPLSASPPVRACCASNPCGTVGPR